jgi:hypothetical protein
MTGYQRKCEHLAGVCDALAQSALTSEQREHLLDLADQWRGVGDRSKIYEKVPPRDAHRSAVTTWLKGLHRQAPIGSTVGR